MPAPNKIIARVGKLRISAFYVGDVTGVPRTGLVCKACAPAKTRMKFLADIIVPATEGDLHYVCYECQTCKRQWSTSSYPNVTLEIKE